MKIFIRFVKITYGLNKKYYYRNLNQIPYYTNSIYLNSAVHIYTYPFI